ncbi:hypothetical protein M3Y99_00639800 [Aphelenchoides fujianensis]|nr:hypothetical protein M3Y99_00639800 [Aphelenchoides fujianensis]
MHFLSATDYRYREYSFQLLDEHVRKPKADWWSRLRPVYLLALLLLFGFAFGWAFGGRIVHFLRLHSPLLIQGCMCNGENFCFKSVNESGGQQFGRPFDCALYSELLRFELVGAPKEQLDAVKSEGKVVATVATAGEFEKLRSFVANTRLVHPHAKIVVYNQGLSGEESEQAAGWCDVIVHSLESSDVPVEGPPKLRALLKSRCKSASQWTSFLPEQASFR